MTWLIDTLVITGGLIALVLLLRRPVARMFGPGVAYALWLLPLLRLVMPPIVLPAPALQPERIELVMPIASAVANVPAPAASASFPYQTALMALWLGGAALFLAWRLGGYAVMRRRVMSASRLVERHGAVRVVESAAVTMPVAFGVIDKVVALPEGFRATYGAQAEELALAHELAHHAGRDLALNLAMQPLLALHWFNPLAWIGWRALRRDQEAACDARVLAGRTASERGDYAGLIAALAQVRQPGLAAPLACAVITEKSIVHRLRSLTMSDLSPRRRLAGRILVAAGALALPLTATISYAAAQAQEELAPPSAPAAPAPPQPHVEHRVVIVEKQGPTADETKLKTKVVTKDGKTIVFKTDKDLSDAEIEKKIEQAMARVPDMPEAPDMAGPNVRNRVIVQRMNLAGASDEATVDTETFEGTGCKGGEPTEVAESADADGQHHSIRIKICAKKYAADAIRKARDEVASDKSIPEDVRARVLKQLDEELEKNAKQG